MVVACWFLFVDLSVAVFVACCLLVVLRWLLPAVCNMLFVVCLRAVCCLQCVVCCLMCGNSCLLFASRCLMYVVCCAVFVVCCVSHIESYSLLVD